MPTVARIGGYRIELHTGRESALPHVHVVHDGRDVVVDLLLLEPYGQQSFRLPGNVRRYLGDHQEELLALWDKYHGR